MKIEDGKITQATEEELYVYWLRNWSDFLSYTDYKKGCLENGVQIIGGKNDSTN